MDSRGHHDENCHGKPVSETAFAVQEGGAYHLRWFTPGGEIDLCGHATLAAAYVIFHFYQKDAEKICFKTLGGPLTVRRDGDLICMDFPSYSLMPVPVTDAMADAIGVRPERAYMGRDLVCILSDEVAVRNAKINQQQALDLNGLLLHITARGKDYDCVSRSFAPNSVCQKIRSVGPGTVISFLFGPPF